LTRVVTFLGKAKYLKEVIETNKLTDVFVDRSYIEGELYYAPNGVQYHFINTGVKYDPPNEMYNRRVRIATMIREIVKTIDDNIIFVDSDVLANNVRKLDGLNRPAVFPIPAKNKPFQNIFIFYWSTNFYLPQNCRPLLKSALDEYLEKNLYRFEPVDLYIHRKIWSVTFWLPGVCHYIDDKKYCI
jgi:hypothetical protein